MNMNSAIKILYENATTFAERNAIAALTEAESNHISDTMITKLFQSVIDKSHVDFDNIPVSKGDITKYSGYTQMMECLGLVRQIADQNNHKIPELGIVEKAVSNIVAYRSSFELGFKLNKDFIILQYNGLVAACVAATSSIIASYMDYAKRIDTVEFKIINSKTSIGNICISQLDTFNTSVAKGEFAKVISMVNKSDNKRAVGESVVVTTFAITAGIIGLIGLLRLLIHYFYYSRMKLAEYLEIQAMFLELNKNNLKAQANGLPAAKRNEVIKKQQKLIDNLHKMADKIKVNSVMTEKKVTTEIKKENSGWKFEDVKSTSTLQDDNGVELL